MAKTLKKETRFWLYTGAIVTASIGSFLIEYSPHTFFLEKYKNILRMYKLGKPVELHDEIVNLYNEVLDDLKITDASEKEKIKPFMISGLDAYHAGIPKSKNGVIIGIPSTYTYQNLLSINTSDIRIGHDKEPLNIYHPSAEDLLDSFILSKKAKKFSIAREILMSQKYLPVYRSSESSAIIIFTALIARAAKLNFKLYEKPSSLTRMAYGTLGLLGFSVWFQIRDSLNLYFEKNVDKELSELGPEYIEGGKEFYEKLLKRNIALRILLGIQGVKTYNRDGDEIFFIRHKRTPITQRKNFFNEMILQLQENNFVKESM